MRIVPLLTLLACATGDAPGPVDAPDTSAPSDPLPVVEATCAPTGDACAPGASVETLFASYRKDAWFPDEVYDEYTDPPLDGGRVHVIGVAAASGAVSAVRIAGEDAEAIYGPEDPFDKAFEWYHVWPRELVAGEPVWVSFHSRSAAWDTRAEATLVVETDQGTAIDGTFPVGVGPVVLTSVTTTADLTTLLVHVQNTSAEAHTVSTIRVQGRDVTDIACLADPQLAPGESALIEVPLCGVTTPGAVWTVAVELEDGPAAVGGGRVLPPSFPVEAWNNSGECPWPGGDDANAASMAAAGIDTHYMHGGVCAADNCDCDSRQVVEEVYGASAGLRTVLTADLALELAPLATTAGVAAVATGDESDGEIYEEDPESETYGLPNAATKARLSREAWAAYPELPTFNGGKTNGHIGTFAGMADIQGMDAYMSACAPHITAFGISPPVRMPYDYLSNARRNHMPLPTWLYSQGLSPAWDQQPVASEILVQGLSVVAAGGKGLMWFQANQELAEAHPATWAALGQVNRIVRAVRDRLWEGAVTGLAGSDGDVIVEAIRARDALVVPLIQLATDQAPTELECLGDAPPHVFSSTLQDVWVDVPADLGVVDAFEVTPDGVVDLAVRADGRRVTAPDLALDDAMPVRLFVLAAHAGVRAEVEAAGGW